MNLLVATRNEHKLREISQILGDRFALYSVTRFPWVGEIVEDSQTLEGNALKKALGVSAQFERGKLAETPTMDFVLADDTGLEVDALEGAPGVHTAYYGQEIRQEGESLYAANNRKLLRELDIRGVRGKARRARFKCVMALARAGREIGCFVGVCEGTIINDHRGEQGFGYDPIFVPEGYCQTFAQLGESVKNEVSHRGRALAALCGFLNDAGGKQAGAL
ncbi:MAG: non-canonical purine NTP pyrophosphatase [Verrucomicrobiae bacterium]|nr:non-canonical purine NTP pyrophosphatase [Verrucomicrobiae bacterium]